MAKTIASVRVGHMVIFKDNPLLYGRMLVVDIRREARKIKLVACLVDPDSWHKRTEYFTPDELDWCPDLEQS